TRELLEAGGGSARGRRELGGAGGAALERPGDQRRHDGGDLRRELVREDGAGGQHVGEQPCGGLRVQGQRIVECRDEDHHQGGDQGLHPLVVGQRGGVDRKSVVKGKKVNKRGQ